MMRIGWAAAHIIILTLAISLWAEIPGAQGLVTATSPPPTPSFILTSPKINEITYVIGLRNVNASWATFDFALPRTRAPDTYVKLKEIRMSSGSTLLSNTTDRENIRLEIHMPNLIPGQLATVNVTFYSLRYKLQNPTHQAVIALSYPNDYAVYAQSEKYIESNNTLILGKAQALVGNLTNTFRIAERMYDFTRTYLTYVSQSNIQGALWALQNGRGDCTEFGTLFAALMRAVGIPARTVVGHSAIQLSQGGIANATSLWVDSPHLWAEFYVEGYGWVPVDPTFGKRDPLDHFGISWAYYLPMIKGPTMDGSFHSLVNVRYPASTKIEFISQLLVTPLTTAPFETAILDLMAANDRTNLARRTAEKAHGYGFNITESYTFLQDAFFSIANVTKAIDRGDPSLARQHASDTMAKDGEALETISRVVMREASASVSRAWRELRILGAIGGDNYLRNARSDRESGDYLSLVQNAYFAKSTADQAPTIMIFLAPLALCIFTIGITRRKMNRRDQAVSLRAPEEERMEPDKGPAAKAN